MKTYSLLFAGLFFAACGQSETSHKASTDLVHIDATADSNAQHDSYKKPVIQFEKLEHDFGNLTQGEILEYEFRFKNTGDADLLITSATASCGCTIPEYPKEPIKPGQSGKIKIKFDSTLKIDQFRKEVYITANTEPAQIILTITGVIKPKPGNTSPNTH